MLPGNVAVVAAASIITAVREFSTVESMRPINLFLMVGLALGWSGQAMAQVEVPVPEIAAPEIPTVEVEQLFPPIQEVLPIEPPPIPEVQNITVPEVPLTEFPATDFGATPLGTPVLDPIPFEAPQLNGPQFDETDLAAPALDAPALDAPALNALQAEQTPFDPPAFDPVTFDPPDLGAPNLSAPTLTFLEAPPSQELIQANPLPQTAPLEQVVPFGN
ncbi:MAG: hypothetical protein HC827_18195 [Cyanobacteria bacterium RM1_2_2]|nr:hypothetical protein [Cyanobacteria bacterium RM1_2_2]